MEQIHATIDGTDERVPFNKVQCVHHFHRVPHILDLLLIAWHHRLVSTFDDPVPFRYPDRQIIFLMGVFEVCFESADVAIAGPVMHGDEVYVGALGSDALHEVLEPRALIEDWICRRGAADALAGCHYSRPSIDGKVDVDWYVAVGLVIAEKGSIGGVGGQGIKVSSFADQGNKVDAIWQLNPVCAGFVVPDRSCQ